MYINTFMNYIKHYNILISRARHRKISGYLEKHHILPRCMGGDNNTENLVALTPREHFIAHILLVKIYPEEHKLIFGVNAMCTYKTKRISSKNRMYGWLRERHASTIKKINSVSQRGSKNSQYGTCWISDVENETSKKIKKVDLSKYINAGWVIGRNKRKIKCKNCSVFFLPIGHEKRCNKRCSKTEPLDNFLTGRESELIELYEKYNHNLNKTLKKMGFSAKGGYFYTAKKILKI